MFVVFPTARGYRSELSGQQLPSKIRIIARVIGQYFFPSAPWRRTRARSIAMTYWISRIAGT